MWTPLVGFCVWVWYKGFWYKGTSAIQLGWPVALAHDGPATHDSNVVKICVVHIVPATKEGHESREGGMEGEAWW